MSLKILAMQLTGQFQTAGKIELKRKTAEKNYTLFREAEKSGELKTYRDLDQWIQSGDYDQKKRETEALVFKGSHEHEQLREFEKLKKNKNIINYLKVKDSSDLKRFEKIEKSEKLKKFRELKEYVKEGQYEQDKQEILSQTFKGSEEEILIKELEGLKKNKRLKAYLKLADSSLLKKHQKFRENRKLQRLTELENAAELGKKEKKELKRLKKDKEIRGYFRFENSREYKYYNEVRENHLLSRYETLIRETRTEEFRKKVLYLSDPKKLQKSEPWKKYIQFKELSGNGDIRFYHQFEKSSLYGNYLSIKDSFQLSRFYELKELTGSPDFLKRKAYLEDPKKWEKTEEYARCQQFLNLKKNPKVELYYKYVNSNDFDFLKQWEVSFSDDFSGNSLDKDKWTPNTYWADRLLGEPFSQPGDLQAYTGGKNVAVAYNKLSLLTKREKTGGKQWLPDRGFVPAEFDYSSDSLSTSRSFWQKEGIFEAKIMFKPVKEVVCSCHLLGESVSPQITLVETGPKSRAGVLSLNASQKPEFNGITLNGLRKGKYYIFTVEWENHHLTWKINERTIFETMLPELEEAVHLNLISLVIDKIKSSRFPVSFETDWIRCYKKK